MWLRNLQPLFEKGPSLAGGVRGVGQEGYFGGRGNGIKNNLIVLIDIGELEVEYIPADPENTMPVAADFYRLPSP